MPPVARGTQGFDANRRWGRGACSGAPGRATGVPLSLSRVRVRSGVSSSPFRRLLEDVADSRRRGRIRARRLRRPSALVERLEGSRLGAGVWVFRGADSTVVSVMFAVVRLGPVDALVVAQDAQEPRRGPRGGTSARGSPGTRSGPRALRLCTLEREGPARHALANASTKAPATSWRSRGSTGASSCARLATPGNVNASSVHARSTEASPSAAARMIAAPSFANAANVASAATASSKSLRDRSLVSGRVAKSFITPRASVCAASHRLNASESFASWNSRPTVRSGGASASPAH